MNQQTNLNRESSFSRTIFINLLIISFMIMSYVYLSDPLGSISTLFLENQEFNIQFGVILLIFGFFSVIAGKFQGLIAGFFGELLYQLAFYDEIYFEWCLIVATFGFLCGIYKYKPLKYQEGIKVYYTFISLIIISIIITSLIIVFQVIFHPSQIDNENIALTMGFEFFLQSIISIVFIIPILLILYDRFLAKEERVIYNMLLTHHTISDADHTFYFKFGRTKIYLCSRCSGVIMGGIYALFFTYLFEQIFNSSINPLFALILCAILPIPGIIDWGTQRLLLRKSTTASRIFTGFIIGNALHFISYTDKYYFIILLIIMFYFTVFFILVYIGYKKEMRIYKKERDNHSYEEEIE